MCVDLSDSCHLKQVHQLFGGIYMATVKASMAGTVWKIVVAEGDKVTAGQDVAILESMKMEIPIAAEEDGVVTKIIANEGDFINVDDDILEIE